MGRRRTVNLRLLTEKDGIYYHRHSACPYKLEWRDPTTGKSQRRFIGVMNKKGTIDSKASMSKAEKLKVEIEDQLNSGNESTLPSVLTWDRAVNQFMSKPGIADATKYDYQRALNMFAKICGNPSSERWSIHLLDTFKTERMSNAASNSSKECLRKVTSSTVNKDLVTLRAFFRWCNKRFNTPNPFDKLNRNETLLKTEQRDKHIWTPQQFEMVLKELDQQWKILALMYVTGAGRRNTLTHLKVSDIHLDDGYILDYESKTKKEILAFIHPRLETELREYMRSLPKTQEYLFTLKFHHDTWNKLTKKLGLPHLPLHDLRSCAMTWLAEAGVSDLITSKVLNHSNPQTTRDYYTRMNELKVRKEAILKLPI